VVHVSTKAMLVMVGAFTLLVKRCVFQVFHDVDRRAGSGHGG